MTRLAILVTGSKAIKKSQTARASFALLVCKIAKGKRGV